MNVADCLVHQGTDVAIRYAGGSSDEARTHDVFRSRVLEVAERIRRAGIEPGETVLVISGSSIELVETILGIIRAGAVAVPLPRASSASLMKTIVDQIRPAGCCVETDPDGELAEILKRHVRVVIKQPATKAGAGAPASRHDGAIEAVSLRRSEKRHDDDQALIIFTSGSTGVPKAVLFTHDHLYTTLRHRELLFAELASAGESETERSPIVTVLPLVFFGGLSICLEGLFTQRTVYIFKTFMPLEFLKCVVESRCAFILLVPGMYWQLIKAQRAFKLNTRSLRYCFSMGEHCSTELANTVEAEFGVKMLSAYGLTECIPGIGHRRESLLSEKTKPGNAGSRVFGEIRLVGEDGTEHQEFGELWVRNDTVRECYSDPDQNARRFHDGWFMTGDLFSRDAEGHYFYQGRVDDMIVYRGRNIYPVELENVLLQYPGIEKACVVPLSAQNGETELGAAICVRNPVNLSDLREFASRRGPLWATVRFVQVLPELRLTSAGKVDRGETGRVVQEGYQAEWNVPKHESVRGTSNERA